jgi:hypothetical protein
MTKCLTKALKAVNLDNHTGIFLALGYDSAGALAHFRSDHYKQLRFDDQQLSRFHALLDVLQQATKEGKICPHYCKADRPHHFSRTKQTEGIVNYQKTSNRRKHFIYASKKSQEDLSHRRSHSSLGAVSRGSVTSIGKKDPPQEFILERSAPAVVKSHPFSDHHHHHQQDLVETTMMDDRPAVEHVKVSGRKLI